MNKQTILSLVETCTGCFACANVCPKDAITLPINEEGFYYPQIDANQCINCGLCDKICPQINQHKTYTMQKAYYGWCIDDNIRKQSSSGGMFAMLATTILKNGGVVFGASFNYENTLRLECHSTEEVPLKELQRSKYVQSYIGYAYRDVKKLLNEGRKVLFAGTPCQNAALSSYLNKDYNNLLLVDFICHGVPSMDLLQKHIDYLGIKNVTEINFRPKNRGWVDDFEIKYQKKQGKQSLIRRIPWEFDEYFCCFQSYKNTRRSCRNCLYCNGKRCSDITLADFWGVQKFKPELWDKRGISLVLSNTEQGSKFVEAIKELDTCILESLELKYAKYVYERSRISFDSPYQNKDRDRFLKDVYTLGYKKALTLNGLKTNMFSIFKYNVKLKLRTFMNTRKSK